MSQQDSEIQTETEEQMNEESSNENCYAEEVTLNELLNSDYAQKYYLSSLLANNAIQDLSNNLFIKDSSSNIITPDNNKVVEEKSNDTTVLDNSKIIESTNDTLNKIDKNFNISYIDENGNEIKEINKDKLDSSIKPDETEISVTFKSKYNKKYLYGSKSYSTSFSFNNKQELKPDNSPISYKYYYLSLLLFVIRYSMEIYMKFVINKQELSENYNLFISTLLNYLFIKYCTKPSYIFNFYRFLIISWTYALIYIANK